MSITVANLQDNRAGFRIFITLLRFSFDSPSYRLAGSYVEKLNYVVAGYYDFQTSVSFSYVLRTMLETFEIAVSWYLCSIESQRTQSHSHRGGLLKSLLEILPTIIFISM